MNSIVDIFEKPIIDDKALTVRELSEQWCVEMRRAREILYRAVADGTAEKVWKKVERRLVPAYRLKMPEKAS